MGTFAFYAIMSECFLVFKRLNWGSGVFFYPVCILCGINGGKPRDKTHIAATCRLNRVKPLSAVPLPPPVHKKSDTGQLYLWHRLMKLILVPGLFLGLSLVPPLFSCRLINWIGTNFYSVRWTWMYALSVKFTVIRLFSRYNKYSPAMETHTYIHIYIHVNVFISHPITQKKTFQFVGKLWFDFNIVTEQFFHNWTSVCTV